MSLQPLPRLRVLLLGAILVSLSTASAYGRKGEEGFPGLKLSRKVTRGLDIPAALGDRVAEVALAYGHTEFDFRIICNKDRDAINADSDARLFYACSILAAEGTGTGTGTVTQPSYPLTQTFLLSSNPSSTKTIYLDFNGHTTSGTVWNTSITSGQNIVTPAYDVDGNPAAFTDVELANIQSIWKQVAEDFAPFNVNVTTTEPPLDKLSKASDADTSYGIRVVIGGSSTWFGSPVGGIAYLGSFSWSSDTPAFVFPGNLGNGLPKYVGEAVSHETGHTFGLSHDGTSAVEYYQGHANWAPIMGVGYYVPVSQWSKGEYSFANSLEDDTAIIASEVNYRTDTHGNTMATATLLTAPTLDVVGIIETRTDVDYFKVEAGAGSATFTVTPDSVSPNLDVQLRLFNSAGTLVATANPTTLNATLTSTLTQGTYYLEVDGIGTGSAITAYNDYGSVGQYRLTGTVAVVRKVPVAITSNSTPLTGLAPLTTSLSGTGSLAGEGTISSYAWTFGDGTTGTGQTLSHVYTNPGVYTATLKVTNSYGLFTTKSVTITVNTPPTVFVGDITMAAFKIAGPKYYSTAAVLVTDLAGKPIPNATVAGAWSGLVKATVTLKTDSTGVARSTSASTATKGTFTFTVSKITMTGYVYNATKNIETKDSIVNPP